MFSVLLPLPSLQSPLSPLPSLLFSFLYSYWCFCNTKIACSLHFYTILFLTSHGFTTACNGLTPHTWFHLRVKHHHPQKFFFWHLFAYSQAHNDGFFSLVLPCYPPCLYIWTYLQWGYRMNYLISVSSFLCSQRAIIIAYSYSIPVT